METWVTPFYWSYQVLWQTWDGKEDSDLGVKVEWMKTLEGDRNREYNEQSDDLLFKELQLVCGGGFSW